MACQSCKSDGPVKNVQWGLFIFGTYIFGAAIYGTIEIVKNLIEYFK